MSASLNTVAGTLRAAGMWPAANASALRTSTMFSRVTPYARSIGLVHDASHGALRARCGAA